MPSSNLSKNIYLTTSPANIVCARCDEVGIDGGKFKEAAQWINIELNTDSRPYEIKGFIPLSHLSSLHSSLSFWQE